MFDHLVYLDPDLDRAIATFSDRYGVEAVPGGSHTGLGTRNALIGLGPTTYLELMALDPEQAVPVEDRFFALESTTRPHFVAWCARADRPIWQTIDIARDAGVRLGLAMPWSRVRPDGTLVEFNLAGAFAEREGGVVPFYIERDGSPNPAASLTPALRLQSLTLLHPQPARIQAILHALDERDVTVRAGLVPRLDVTLERAGESGGDPANR